MSSHVEAQSTAAAYNLTWLLDLLQADGSLDAQSRREVEVKAPAQRARLAKNSDGADSQVSPAQLVASLTLTDANGRVIDEDRIARSVAHRVGLPYHKIDPLRLDMHLVTRTLSRPFALRHAVLPITEDAATLVVAVENPFDTEVVENLQRVAKKDIRIVVACKVDILKCITEIYGFRQSIESAASEETPNDTLYDFEQLVRLKSVGEIEGSDQHIVNAVEFLFKYAFDQRASDIHIEPRREDAQVRLRIDGVLHDAHTVPRKVYPAIVSRIKTLARLDIAERRRPQDGRIKTVLTDKAVEMRVSTLPVAFGEKAVLRIFDPHAVVQSLPSLGLEPDDKGMFERWLAEPHGLILITGPTGSGKTTTLYTALRSLADDTVNITTVEDPIELVTDVFNQVAVQPKAGIDFASALRTILRQDPDIIMVGEIRDAATAEMAVQAALTGHLVFSTLHTNDTVSALTRLVDLGTPPFLVTSTLIGVMAQRLLRRNCAACSGPHALDASHLAAVGANAAEVSLYDGARRGTGCPRCRGTGYFGRIGIFEMLDVHAPLRQALASGASVDTLLSIGKQQGLVTLRDCALRRLADGVTTFEEVVRVTGGR